MYGKATLEIPGSETLRIPSATFNNLPDDVARKAGQIAACTLSEEDGHIILTLSDGTVETMYYDTVQNKVVIGHLTHGV